jgi:hypothetical protein
LTAVTEWDDLPPAAQDYVTFVAERGAVPVTMLGVGPARDQFVQTPMTPLSPADTRHDDDDYGDTDDWEIGPGVLVL